jgi:hypothetical protein
MASEGGGQKAMAGDGDGRGPERYDGLPVTPQSLRGSKPSS